MGRNIQKDYGQTPQLTEARRVFAQGGVSLGAGKVTDVKLLGLPAGEQVMKIGKNKFFMIQVKS